MNQVERIELSTASDELVILERLNQHEVVVCIMDGDGEETRARISAALLTNALKIVRAEL